MIRNKIFLNQSYVCIYVSGNHYGTPKPSPESGAGKADPVIPGQHPSSEGKRRRNRSNVEAMAAKHSQEEPQENQRELSTNGM